MARSLVLSQQKLAEKLTILNDRGVGMLTRIYNIKKVCIYIIYYYFLPIRLINVKCAQFRKYS